MFCLASLVFIFLLFFISNCRSNSSLLRSFPLLLYYTYLHQVLYFTSFEASVAVFSFFKKIFKNSSISGSFGTVMWSKTGLWCQFFRWKVRFFKQNRKSDWQFYFTKKGDIVRGAFYRQWPKSRKLISARRERRGKYLEWDRVSGIRFTFLKKVDCHFWEKLRNLTRAVHVESRKFLSLKQTKLQSQVQHRVRLFHK